MLQFLDWELLTWALVRPFLRQVALVVIFLLDSSLTYDLLAPQTTGKKALR